MAQPVWNLSVNLETKTAVFQSGLADAAKSARSSFSDIRDSSRDMSDGVRGATGDAGYSMMEARHSTMMLAEEFGIRLPRSLTMFIASLGPIGGALEAAFPWLAVILGATLLIEHLEKIGAAERELLDASHKLTDGMAENINKVDLELTNTELGIRKLAGAPGWDLLAEKLRLEDAQKGFTNVSQLEGEIQKLIKSTPATSNWNPFNWGDNSADVQAKAKALQEQMRGKGQEDQAGIAQDALALQSKILEQMKAQTSTSDVELKNQQKYVEFLKQESEQLQKQADEAGLANQLQQGQDYSNKIQKAQEAQRRIEEIQRHGLDERIHIEGDAHKKHAEMLAAEVAEEQQAADLKFAADRGFASAVAKLDEERRKLAEQAGKQEGENESKMGQLKAAAAREADQLTLSAMRNSQQARLASELRFAEEVFKAKQNGFDTELAALDKTGKEYENKLKEINDKQKELTIQHENEITQIKNKAEEERNSRIVSAENRANDEIARSATNLLMRKESIAKTMISLGDQVMAA